MIIKYTQQNSFSHYWPGWQHQAEAWQALMVTSSKRGDEQKQETSFNLKMKKIKLISMTLPFLSLFSRLDLLL